MNTPVAENVDVSPQAWSPTVEYPTISALEDLKDYQFPEGKLKRTMVDSSKTPLVLVACGKTQFELCGAYLSPVSDAYRKKGLATNVHRLRMCELAVQTSSQVMLDPWEALQREYSPTALVLDHFDHEINEVRKGVATVEGGRKAVRIALIGGADLLQTMDPDGPVWLYEDLDHILGKYGIFVIERSGTIMSEALEKLNRWRHNIYPIEQKVQNNVSSTTLRSFLGKNEDIQYLTPDSVVEYIHAHQLYKQQDIVTGVSTGNTEGSTKLPISPPDSEASQS